MCNCQVGKIGKDINVRNVRMIVGDKLLIAAIQSIWGLLSNARELSRRVYASGCDDLNHLRDEKDYTVIFTFSGSLDPHVFWSTTTKFGECQINNIGCMEWMKYGNNQLASVHLGALTQFMLIWNNSGVQEEVLWSFIFSLKVNFPALSS